MANLNDAEVAAALATRPAREARMILSSEGPEGSGKTDFALRNTPRPVLFLDFDYGFEGLEPAILAGVERKAYNLLGPTLGLDENAMHKHAAGEMKRFLFDFGEGIRTQQRTIVVDTFTAAWAGQRLSRKDDRYVEIEEEFRTLVRMAYVSPHSNLILIHHVKPDWKRDSSGKSYKSGTFSRDGMDGINTMVQLAIRHRWVPPANGTPGAFELDILKCRDNQPLVGMSLPVMDFPSLCSLACAAKYPNIDWSK
jgi:hypothetical protein